MNTKINQNKKQNKNTTRKLNMKKKFKQNEMRVDKNKKQIKLLNY